MVTLLCSAYLLILNSDRNSLYSGNGLWKDYTIETITIEGKKRRLVLADSPEQWTKGLMYVRKPTPDFEGMIFKFPDKQPRLFWNQNTLETLTIYWLAEGKVIGQSTLPSIEISKKIVTVQSPAPADTVVEIIQ